MRRNAVRPQAERTVLAVSPRVATLVLTLPALLLISAANVVGLVPARTLTALYVLVFVWVGSSRGRWDSLVAAPFAAASFSGSVLLAERGMPLNPQSVVVVSLVCVLVAETVARSQERLRASEAELRFLVENATDMVTRVGADGTIRYSAPSVERQLGWRPEQVVGLRTVDLRHPDDPDPVALALASSGRPVTVERRLRRADGEFVWLESVAQAVTGPDGRREVLISGRDISRRRLATDELERRAAHDSLTGLLNRTRLVTSLQRALRDDPALPRLVAFVDLDGFKAVNDRHGHQVGDRLLVQVARRLVGITRDSDLVARYGGDEFVLVVEGMGDAELPSLVKRIEAELTTPYRMGTLSLNIGASVGVAVARPGTAVEELVAEADRAMYLTKATRRPTPVAPAPRRSTEAR